MARITTLTAMRSYIKNQLGSPVITVEIADSQLNQIIEDCIQIYQKYNTGEGNYVDYLPFTVSANTSAYNVSAYNIGAVVDFDLTSVADGLNVLFSTTHNLLYKDWVVYGNYPGGPGSGGTLSNYEIQSQYLEDIRDMFGTFFHAHYSEARQEILLIPTPTIDGIGIMTVYRKETAENLYNDDLVKRLCIAKSKMLWGSMLKKYNSTLPGGATINGSEIFNDGKDEYESVFAAIVDESEPPMPVVE